VKNEQESTWKEEEKTVFKSVLQNLSVGTDETTMNISRHRVRSTGTIRYET
jgi:hypothetical protein